MPVETDIAEGLSPVVSEYRRRLAAQGLFDSQDDYEVVGFLGKQNPALLEQNPEFGRLYGSIREANAPSLAGETSRAFKQGAIGLASTAVGGAGLFTGSDYLKRKAAALNLQASEPDLAATIPTLEDIAPGEPSAARKIFSRDALRYGLSKIGGVAPSIAESVAVAGAGALLGSAAGPAGAVVGAGEGLIEKSLIKAAMKRLIAAGAETTPENVAKAARAIGAFRGGVAATAGSSVLLNSGDVASEGADTGTSIGLGLVSAIPDTILPAYVLSKLFPGVAKKAAVEAGKTFLARNAKKIAELVGVPASEFGQEGFQQAVNIVARNIKDGKDPLTLDDANWREIREASITGAFGGLLAAPGVMLSGGGAEPPAAVRPPPAAPPPATTAPLPPIAPVAPPQEPAGAPPATGLPGQEIEFPPPPLPVPEPPAAVGTPVVAPAPVDAPAPIPTAAREAPVTFLGIEDWGEGYPIRELWNLTEDIPGHPKGSTLSRTTLESEGFIVPPAPAAGPVIPVAGIPPADSPVAPTPPIPSDPAGAPPATGLPGQEIEFPSAPEQPAAPAPAPTQKVYNFQGRSKTIPFDQSPPDNMVTAEQWADIGGLRATKPDAYKRAFTKALNVNARLAKSAAANVGSALATKTGPGAVRQFAPRQDGVVDIIDAIQESGGVPRPGDNRGGEFDGFEDAFRGPAKSLVSKSTGGWDQFMQDLVGRFPQFASVENSTAGQLGDMVNAALTARSKLRRDMAAQRMTIKFEERALGGIAQKAGPPIQSDTLATKTKFKVGGVPFEVSGISEDGTVTVRDGPEYGTQIIPAGVPVFPDKNTLRRAKLSTDFLSEEQLAPEQPTPAVAPLAPLPTNVIPINEIPFNLVPESQVEPPSAVKLAEDAAAIKAEQDKQADMFGDVGPAPRFQTRAESAPFYSRLNRAVELSQQTKATGAQWKATIRNAKIGINRDEFALARVDDLEDGKTYTKQEVLDHLRANEVQVREVVLGGNQDTPADTTKAARLNELHQLAAAHPERLTDADNREATELNAWLDKRRAALADRTHFSGYQLPGAKEGSYREVLLTVPEGPRNPNAAITAEAFNNKNGGTDYHLFADGKPWIDVGFGSEVRAVAEGQRLWREGHASDKWNDGHSQYRDIPNPVVRLRLNERTTSDGKRMFFVEEAQPPQKGEFEKMPAAFQKNWREIAFKWALRKASAEGYDSLGWTTGEHQAARYDLSKQVESIEYGGGFLRVKTNAERGGTRNFINEEVAPENLEKYIGKEAARKLLEAPKEKVGQQGDEPIYRQTLESGDLKIGGEGLKKLYDSDFRNVVNNLPAVKRAGQKVGVEEIDAGPKRQYYVNRVNGDPRYRVMQESFETPISYHESVDAALKERDQPTNTQKVSVHALTITPEIRAAAMEGQPVLRTVSEPRTSTEPANPAVQAQRTQQFQITMARLVSNGADVQAMSRELLVQQTGEVLQQQIAALQTRLAAATTAPQRNAIQRQLDIRAQRLSEIEQMRGVTYSPYHIAIAMDDVMNASVDNLVTLLHEAAESLTMRLGPEMQAAVFRAVEATTAEMTAKMQAAAKNTGATIANVGEPGELLAETMAQKLAAEGIPESPSLAQAIVRWIKEIYYRVAMAAQRAFGAEPNLELALNWYENQLRRELGGDYEYAFSNLLDRFLPEQNKTAVQRFTGASGTPGGIVDFFDPVTQTMRQPWVEPLSDGALDWNMRFQTSGVNPGDADGIPRDEAVRRVAAAAYNDQVEWLEKQRKELAPDMDPAEFYGLFGRGVKMPAEMLAALEAQQPGVSSAQIGGERMTDVMNGLAKDQNLKFFRGLQAKHLDDAAKMQTAVKSDQAEFDDRSDGLNRLESDVRNKELHEAELKKRAKSLVEGLIKSYARGIRAASRLGSLGELMETEEGLGPKDPMPQFYRDTFNNLLKGEVPLFEYIEAIALLDMPLASMTPAEIWAAIRKNADTSEKLRELSRNKPLALTISVMARDGARQVDQIQLRRADGPTFIDIHKELEGIRNATEAQLRVMLKTIDEKNTAKGLRQRIRTAYLKERRALQRISDRMAAAETRIDLLEKAKPAVTAKVGEAEQAIGGILSDWQPFDGADLIVMRRQADGTFQEAIRKLQFTAEGPAVDSDGIHNDLFQNNQWLDAEKARAGEKKYNQIEHQTRTLEKLDLDRLYPAHNFGKVMGFIDSFVRPLSAIAQQAGHSSGARVNAQFNQYVFINRGWIKALKSLSHRWVHAQNSVMKSTGIKDYGQFLKQIYNPVKFFLSVNPGFDQAQAIRAATREARARLTTEPTADFAERFERFLLVDHENDAEMVRNAEQARAFVSDPKLGDDLRHALPRGWSTGMRGMNPSVVVTLITDMQKAGWNLEFKDENKTKVATATTFADVTSETAQDAEALSAAITPYFTPGILDRWLKPFINKPGESVFKYDGQDISQLDLQAAWAKAGGDVVAWIDALGERLGVQEAGANQAEEMEAELEGDVDESGGEKVDNTAKFRVHMLREIDRVFGWEARLAYEANQTPDLFNAQGTKLHVMMDARVNDLLPEEHVKFFSHDPESSKQILGHIAFHGAFGRNGQALVANLSELTRVLEGPKLAFESLPSTTVEGKKRDAAAIGRDYKTLKLATERYYDVEELRSKIESAMGVNNIYGPLHDARAAMELLGVAVGQIVDQPKTGALNFVQIGQRPFAMHSMGPMALKSVLVGYGELAKNSFGGVLRSVGIDLIRQSEFAKETGNVEGAAFRREPWGVVMSDMGKEGSFQNSLVDKTVIRGARKLRAIQDKGVGIGMFKLPGAGVMASFATEGAISVNRGGLYLLQEIIDKGIRHFASHPEDMANPAFRFNVKNLKMKYDEGVYDWFRNKTVEFNMGPIEQIVRGAVARQAAGERTLTTRMVEQMAQMNAQELDGASSINTSPSGMLNNPVLKYTMPLLRWPLWMMHAAHKGLASAEGRADFRSMMGGIARLAAINLPLGLAFTFMIDWYDDKILGKKNPMPRIEKVAGIPFIGPALALATTERGISAEISGMTQRIMRSGNIYGLGADVIGQFFTSVDPSSGQRVFSLDQRVLVMSQLMNMQQAVRNMVAQGGTATWGSVYRPLVASIGGNGMLNSLGVINNLLELDNEEARNNNRINAARWVNTAAKEIGVPVKSSSGFSSPTEMSVWTRGMQLAAQANDRMGFMEAYQRALAAAREHVAQDDRVPVDQREKEAAQRVLQSWRTRNPFSGLNAPPTPIQIQQLLRAMDDGGRSDVQEAMRRYETYTQFIAPSPMERYLNARIRPPQNAFNQIERMRRQAAGSVFAP